MLSLETFTSLNQIYQISNYNTRRYAYVIVRFFIRALTEVILVNMSDEKLVKYIKRYPVLYNSSMTQYRDAATRNVAWEEISQQMRIPVEDLKTRWAKLRNCFTNAMKRRRRKLSQELRYIMPWKYEDQMDFLLPYLSTRKKTSSSMGHSQIDSSMNDTTMNDDDDSIKGEQFIYYERPPSIASSHNNSIISNEFKQAAATGQNHNNSYHIKEIKPVREKQEMDEHDYFFMSMSKQFKELPRSDQSDIKFQIHKLIYEAEKRQQSAYSNSV